MAEYEVESVTEARVVKKSKKVIWEYNVKWKGYDTKDNTWEPAASFVGSEEILATFWRRADVGGRDTANMTLFQVGETFVPVGPPPRKLRKASKPDIKASSPPAPAAPTREGTRSAKRRRSSPPAIDVDEKPAKRTRGRVSEPEARPQATPERPRRPDARQATSSSRSIRRNRKRTPSPDIVPPSEDDEEGDVVMMLAPPDPQPQAQPSASNMADLSIDDDDDPIALRKNDKVQDDAPPLPAHRARAAKPLVKMVDDFTSMEGAIPAKARVKGQNGASSETPEAGPSSRPAAPARKSTSKPGPGRSSQGLKKNTSSVLTFEKGALKTVKGKFMEKDKAEEDTGMVIDETGPIPETSEPVVPPTGDELLKLGGFDPKAAEALDDFEDDGPAPEHTTAAVQESNTNNGQPQRVLATNNLFPTATAAPVSNNVAWRRLTIFGPLFVPLLFMRQTFMNILFPRALGSDVLPTPSESPPFLLTLDTTVDVPLQLSAVTQSLDTIIIDEKTNNFKLPGKFFLADNALKMLDTVRTMGPSAIVTAHSTATDEQKGNFERLQTRLDNGELFTAMSGSAFLAFCSSKASFLHRLNLPSALTSRPNSVFVSLVEIHNSTAYVEIVDTACKWK